MDSCPWRYAANRTLHLGEQYGLKVGCPAKLLILSAPDDFEMIRSQDQVLMSIRDGKVLMQCSPIRVERFAS